MWNCYCITLTECYTRTDPLQQITECSNDDDLKQLLGSEDYNFHFDAGVCIPSTAASVKQKDDIALALAKHYLLYSTMAELEQLKAGLEGTGGT